MVLGRADPPADPARRRPQGESYAARALGIDDRFVRIARRYAQGAFGLGVARPAPERIRRALGTGPHGPAEDRRQARGPARGRRRGRGARRAVDGLCRARVRARWVGRVWDMYRSRGFGLPGSVGGASAYLAQHDFVHVLADYGTNLNGELEVFALDRSGRPRSQGLRMAGDADRSVRDRIRRRRGLLHRRICSERRLDSVEMHVRIADALRRGRNLCDRLGVDLLEVDYHDDFVARSVPEVRAELGIDPKSDAAVSAGSAGRVRPAPACPASSRSTPHPSTRRALDDEVRPRDQGAVRRPRRSGGSCWSSGTRRRR